MIQTYEFGLSELLQRHMITTDVGWPKEARGVSPGTDSVLGIWSRMLVARFPFVKRTVFEDNRFADQRDAIALFIRQEFGVDLT